MKLLLENWRQYLNETEEEVRVLVPPSSLEAGRELIATTAMPGQDLEDEFEFTVDGEDEPKTGTHADFVKTLKDDVVPHEAIHALQMREMPELFKGLPEIDLGDSWEESSPAQIQRYYSRPPEIMAFAYDYVADVGASSGSTREELYNSYEEIGGDVFETFKKYIEAYKKQLAAE
tara:strand:- start:8 stop:532 length:525 start_codon:yes stop_codon:yes gene_type:complete